MDAEGRETRRQWTIDTVTRTQTTGYHPEGLIAFVEYPDGTDVGTALDPWTYDAAGRTLTVPGLIADATYNARHQTTSIDYANGIATSFAYDDARGWVTAIDNQDAQQVSIYAKGYTRNPRGQITATTSSRAAQEWVYSYDNLDRLIGADNLGDNSMDQTFTWSISGNLTYNSALGTYTYPAPTAARPHAPTGVGAETLAYDAAGNMTTGLEGRTIAHDGANRPVQVAWRNATTNYLYGPMGQAGEEERWPGKSDGPALLKLDPLVWSRPSTKDIRGPGVAASQRDRISDGSESDIPVDIGTSLPPWLRIRVFPGSAR